MQLDVSEVEAVLNEFRAEVKAAEDAALVAANRRPQARSALSKLMGALGG